ncbi:PatA/PatG family cyanobactin maturation protease, partial [Microcystis aeruginosa]
ILFSGSPLTGETMSESVETQATVEASGCGCGGTPETTEAQRQNLELSAATSAPVIPVAPIPNPVITSQGVPMPETTNKPVTPSQAAEPAGGIVYAIGTLGYDFGSEARRDTFKQLMPTTVIGGIEVPSNPYDARQMVDYLADNLSEAKSLIWTLNLELTPIYAIEPLGSFSREVYAALQELLSGQVQAEDSPEYIERVSIPGRITGRTVRLFSGQVVPVIEPDSPRGIYGWHINTLVSAAIEAVGAEQTEAQESQMRRTLSSFLNRIYYDLRNLGQTSQDRALNFAATNAFQAAQTFSEAVGAGMELDSINVSKSPFCRLDSDCWDVQLKFFDPENSRRARKIFRFTIDVSDLIPVTLGEVRSWSSPY